MLVSAIWERRSVALLTGLAAFGLGLAYLFLKARAVSGIAGFDFRYLWVAANVWAAGMDPYRDAFLDFAKGAITEGHVPPLWPYPPTWWALSLTLPLDDLLAANWAFNLACIAMLLVSSLIVGAVLASLWAQKMGLDAAPWHAVFAVQGLTVLVIAATETTAIHLSVGQTTAFSVLGGALLLWGQSRNAAIWRILGFVLLFLKPQLGVPFAAAYFVASPRALADLIPAGLLSLLLALPAIVADPTTISGFLRNAVAYQDVSIANHPAATTGLRSAFHAVSGIDIGNFVPLGLACVVAMLMVWHHGGRGGDPRLAVPLSTLAVLAIGPLHYYDFTLVLLALPLLAVASGARFWLFVAGYALIFRADNLGAAIGFYDPDVGIFEGSWLSTIGAASMLLSVSGRRQDHRPVPGF